MTLSIAARLVAFCLILESLFTAVNVASLLSLLAGYDAVAIALIGARGLVAALQFMGGWKVATHGPQGHVLARWGLVSGAILTVFDVGLNFAPSWVYPWLRWQATAGYAAYAAAGWFILTAAERGSRR